MMSDISTIIHLPAVIDNTTMLPLQSGWLNQKKTNQLTLCVGDTSLEVCGAIRFNGVLKQFEGFDGVSWVAFRDNIAVEHHYTKLAAQIAQSLADINTFEGMLHRMRAENMVIHNHNAYLMAKNGELQKQVENSNGIMVITACDIIRRGMVVVAVSGGDGLNPIGGIGYAAMNREKDSKVWGDVVILGVANSDMVKGDVGRVTTHGVFVFDECDDSRMHGAYAVCNAVTSMPTAMRRKPLMDCVTVGQFIDSKTLLVRIDNNLL
jgi:hypothetical protein